MDIALIGDNDSPTTELGNFKNGVLLTNNQLMAAQCVQKSDNYLLVCNQAGSNLFD